jgi:hypothetical protein
MTRILLDGGGYDDDMLLLLLMIIMMLELMLDKRVLKPILIIENHDLGKFQTPQNEVSVIGIH